MYHVQMASTDNQKKTGASNTSFNMFIFFNKIIDCQNYRFYVHGTF